MRCVVTGAAGFLGSHVCEELLRRGHSVVGIDCFVPYYPAAIKAQNQAVLLAHPHYHFHALDLRKDDLTDAVDEADVVFHLAAMPGLPKSWTDFDGYWTCNVQATQRLLEACRSVGSLKRFVLASTSSVYGRNAIGSETTPTNPISPYGVTKLAAEHLAKAYQDAFGLPLVTLRYFSIYGPRQRPDMAYHRFIMAISRGMAIELYGDGQQIRGNTYVGDAVTATIAAIEAPVGETYNVGGGETASVLEIIRRLETISGRHAEMVGKPIRLGDQRQTFADTSKLRNHLKWEPLTRLDDGLARQWQWQTQAMAELNMSAEPIEFSNMALTRTPPPKTRKMAVTGASQA
jgi:nucleoside-diphosphate-sugar epimerase